MPGELRKLLNKNSEQSICRYVGDTMIKFRDVNVGDVFSADYPSVKFIKIANNPVENKSPNCICIEGDQFLQYRYLIDDHVVNLIKQK